MNRDQLCEFPLVGVSDDRRCDECDTLMPAGTLGAQMLDGAIVCTGACAAAWHDRLGFDDKAPPDEQERKRRVDEISDQIERVESEIESLESKRNDLEAELSRLHRLDQYELKVKASLIASTA